MSEACLFCRIANGDVPAHEIYRNDRIAAFLDIEPIRPGHIQIIPAEHYDYFDDLPSELAAEILELGQRLSKTLKSTLGVDRVSFLFTGGDIAHAHAHLVPMVEPTDITSRRYIKSGEVTFGALPRARDADLRDMASRLTQAFSSCHASRLPKGYTHE